MGARGDPWGPGTHSRARFYGDPLDSWALLTGGGVLQGILSVFWEAATPCRFPNLQAVARNVMGRCVAGGSRPEGVDFARIDPPEFFSAPATPFLASKSAATNGDFVSAVLAAEDNSCLAFSTVGEGGALGIQVGGGWVRPISVRFGMGRD